jgi:tetratricopeptide (TPR) repeat protein
MESYLTKLKALAEADFNAENVIAITRALQDREEFDSALRFANKAIDSGINVALLYAARANILRALNCWDEVVSSYKKALSVAPNEAGLYGGLGSVLVEHFKDYEGAEQLFLRAIETSPNDQSNYDGYAESIIHQGLFKDILHTAEKRLNGNGNNIMLLGGIATALIDYGRYEEAQECAEVLLGREPGHWAALTTLARIADDQLQDYNAGWRYLMRAIKNNPSDPYYYRVCVFHLAKTGEWEQARAVFRDVYQRMRPSFFNYEGVIPYWDGTNLRGKTILLDSSAASMGGHGDTIQFIRFAPWLKAQGATVGVISRKATLSLIETMPGVDFVIERYDTRPFVDYIFDPSLLWLMLEVKIEEVGSAVPYLSSSPEKCEKWKNKIPRAAGLNVGIVWGCDPLHRYWSRNRYTRRSMPLADLLCISQTPGLQLYGLQKEGLPDGFYQPSSGAVVKDLSQEVGDFYNTAAAVSALDVIVTVDTSMAHLASAMGKATFILLPYASDFRWLLNQDDCPWYPGARLFRQDKPGDWAGVIRRVSEALRNHTPLTHVSGG